MDSLTDSRHISRLEIVDTGRRRRWPDEAKARIVEESLSGRRLGSATARRHGISNQLLFAWRKAYRAGRLGVPVGFVPAMIVSETPEKDTGSGCGRIEIVSTNGRRVLVDGNVEVEALLRILRGLERLP
ncbi:MAG TPA: transposase [Acidobacteriaceae bacterium]|nr:transposase [Acidobacteriaceae bacterium]